MMANDPNMGPSFASFDGHDLDADDEFAFSQHESIEEWQAARDEFRLFDDELEDDELEDDELEEDELDGDELDGDQKVEGMVSP